MAGSHRPSLDSMREPDGVEIAHLLARLKLVELMHPAYFFNFRKRTMTQIQDAWAISEVGVLRRVEAAV